MMLSFLQSINIGCILIQLWLLSVLYLNYIRVSEFTFFKSWVLNKWCRNVWVQRLKKYYVVWCMLLVLWRYLCFCLRVKSNHKKHFVSYVLVWSEVTRNSDFQSRLSNMVCPTCRNWTRCMYLTDGCNLVNLRVYLWCEWWWIIMRTCSCVEKWTFIINCICKHRRDTTITSTYSMIWTLLPPDFMHVDVVLVMCTPAVFIQWRKMKLQQRQNVSDGMRGAVIWWLFVVLWMLKYSNILIL